MSKETREMKKQAKLAKKQGKTVSQFPMLLHLTFT